MNCIYVSGKKDIIKNVADNKKFVVFGAGGTARLGITKLGVADKVEFLVDNDCSKWGKFYNAGGSKWAIKSPETLQNLNDTYVVFIISQYYNEIIKQLEGIGCFRDKVCLIYMNHRCADLPEQTMAHYEDFLQIIGADYAEAKKEKLSVAETKGIKPFVIPKIAFQVTTKCTMRCENCLTLTPYFKTHYEYDIGTLKNDIDNILRAVDRCDVISLIGGETFLYPHLAEAIEYAAASPKIFHIVIATNGTIMPSETLMKMLRNPKVYVEITDYGNIVKTAALVMAFAKYDITFKIKHCTGWIDYGDITKRGKSINELNMHFKACTCGHYAKRMFNGKLWGCLRACDLDLLGIDIAHDSVLIKDTDTIEEIRNKIEYLYGLDYLEACNHCDGGVLPVKYTSWVDQNDPDGTKNSKHTIIPLDEYIALTKLKEEHSLYSDI